jgi:hypothetical protein
MMCEIVGECQYDSLETLEGGVYHYRCAQCGRERKSRYPLHKIHGLCRGRVKERGKRVVKSVHKAPLSEPRLPTIHTQAWNLAKAVAAFVADGCKTLPAEEYQARLASCDTCVPPDGYRVGNRCSKCGCRLSLKAQGRAFKCPAGRWSETTD